MLTEKGSKEVATTFQFLVTPPTPTTVKGGFVQVAKDYGAWQADMVKYAVKPPFFGMNITEPAQYSSHRPAGQGHDHRRPARPQADLGVTGRGQDLAESGGDKLRKFYEGIKDPVRYRQVTAPRLKAGAPC